MKSDHLVSIFPLFLFLANKSLSFGFKDTQNWNQSGSTLFTPTSREPKVKTHIAILRNGKCPKMFITIQQLCSKDID